MRTPLRALPPDTTIPFRLPGHLSCVENNARQAHTTELARAAPLFNLAPYVFPVFLFDVPMKIPSLQSSFHL